MISNTNSTAHRPIYYENVQQFHGEPQEEGFGVTFKYYYENGKLAYEGEFQNGARRKASSIWGMIFGK